VSLTTSIYLVFGSELKPGIQKMGYTLFSTAVVDGNFYRPAGSEGEGITNRCPHHWATQCLKMSESMRCE
jgi:hypothetical protein